MSYPDILTMCLRNLFKRKLRTILTMLGVVIGTVAIVVTISLGLAADARFLQLVEQFGDVTIVTVQNPANVWWMPDDGEDRHVPDLDTAAARMFENIPDVVAVLPTLEAQFALRSGDYEAGWIRVMGVRPQAMAALGYQVTEGRLLQEGNNLEVVFGGRAELSFHSMTDGWSDREMRDWMGEEVEAYVDIFNDRITLFPDPSVLWRTDAGGSDGTAQMPVRPLNIEVVGLLERSGDWTTDNSIFMDIELIQRLRIEVQRQQQQNQMMGLDAEDSWGHINANANVVRDIGYDNVFVRASSIDTVADVHEEITSMGFPAWFPAQGLNTIQDMVASQQMMLAAIGAVSLFVAAIAIANTMVMSTYERTREIGVMKVIGAGLPDIKKLFLLEAAMIGFFGGLFGVGFSYLVSYILNHHSDIAFMGGMMDMWVMGEQEEMLVSLITPWLSGMALVFTALIGLISGYFPARRATKLSALNAIRTE